MKGNKKQKEALYLAVKIVGGQTLLAKKLGITRQALNRMLLDDRPLPIRPTNHVLKIERLTNGVVHRSMLAPDIYPPDEYRKD